MENNSQNNTQQKKSHKKFWVIGIAVIIFLVMVCGLSSVNNKKNEGQAEEKVKTADSAASEAPTGVPAGAAQNAGNSNEQAADSSSGTLGDYTVSILDAEQTKDYNGNPALIINFDYQNNSNDSQMFSTAVSCTAYQNGVELSSAFILNGTYDAEASLKKIQPGSSLKVQRAFELPDASAPVTVEVTEFISFNDKKLTKVFTF